MDKGKFGSNFGFLMASIGSAVGLGNIWSFPYKMGIGGGFSFLLVYLILAIFVGYPLMVGEMALGRKTGKAAIEGFADCNRSFKIAGVFETVVPFLLICFYVTFGGYVTKYMVANFGDLIHAGFGFGGGDAGASFGGFITGGAEPMVYTYVFIALTVIIVMMGVGGGIEKFCSWAMPALFVMLIVVVIRSCTLPGAGEGLAFLFKPNFEAFAGTGWCKVLAQAGSQMFFSLSLASGCLVAYGSYLGKEANLEKNAIIVPVCDTLVAVLAGMAVMPAVFAYGMEPGGGPGLLFVTLQTVFNNMAGGAVFGFVFYLLVFFAALTSSIGMMEGGISAMEDAGSKRGSKHKRSFYVWVIGIVSVAGGTLVTYDALGSAFGSYPFGQTCILDFFDLGAEGILMPLGGLLMAIMFGWTRRHWIDDEVEAEGNTFKSKAFVDFCFRWVGPIFMGLLLIVQINAFFHFTKLF